MSTTAIILEFVVIGFWTLATVCFAILSILRIHDFSLLLQTKELATVLVLVITLLSYFFGALLNQLSFPLYLFFIKLSKSVYRARFLRFLMTSKLMNWVLEDGQEWLENDRRTKWDRMRFLILDNGSDNLIERLKYMQSLSRLFKGVAIISPFFGVSFALWLFTTFGRGEAALITILICFILSFLSTVAAYDQDQGYRREMIIASEIIQEKICLSNKL